MTTRTDMLERQLKGRGITDPQVLKAMEDVDRSLFVPASYQHKIYDDGPLPIGKGQTISQPYIVAYMAQALNLKPTDTVLEIGTGCGYNAAVLSRLAKAVYSIEIIESLAKVARENIAKTGYKNIELQCGDGYLGWPSKAPFNGIVLTAAPPQVPEDLKQQLAIGGNMVAPVGQGRQQLVKIHRKSQEEFSQETLLPVRFVPMTEKGRK